jgi:hypothetical protein
MVFLVLQNANQPRYLIYKKTFNPHISVLIFHCEKNTDRELNKQQRPFISYKISLGKVDENKYATAKSDARMIEEKVV